MTRPLATRGRVIGRSRHELTTPALVLDLDVARRNIALMAEHMRALPADLRPHTKVHKSPEVARLQLEAGATGVTTATVWEAAAMVEEGIDDVLIANQVVGPGKASALAELAIGASIAVAVDDPANAAELSSSALAAGSEIGVVVEVDVGMGRAGVRSAADALALARAVASLPGLRLRGLMGYEGHCMLEPDRQRRVGKQAAAMEILMAAADALLEEGLPLEVISAGGTGTYDLTGAHPRVTEVQAGSYVFMDAFHQTLMPDFPVALTVAATVASRQGQRVVLDCGFKSIGVNLCPPRLARGGGDVVFVHEEHCGVDVPGDSPLRVGDVVELESGYGPATVNLYDAYHVVEGGTVVDVWPIRARYGRDTIA